MRKCAYRSNPRPCELCGQLVVSVCDSLDMGDAVTCHYEPATEDEKAKRIAELEAENAALHSRLEFTSCQKADVEAQVLQLEEQNAALRQDAAVGRAIHQATEQVGQVVFTKRRLDGDDKVRFEVDLFAPHEEGNWREYYGDTLPAALAAAGLMDGDK